jgi:predicted RNA-binding protein with PIN domain
MPISMTFVDAGNGGSGGGRRGIIGHDASPLRVVGGVCVLGAMQKIVIDGYNVIHADPALRREASKGMEGARAALLGRLRVYIADKDVQITVVFDGAGGMVDAESVVPGRLQVLYSASGQSADALIVSTLHEHPNPREYIVVTSDMADIGRAVGAAGAVVMSSPEFLERLDGPRSAATAPAGEEKPHPSEQDVDYWLEKFAEGEAGEGKTGDRDD